MNVHECALDVDVHESSNKLCFLRVCVCVCVCVCARACVDSHMSHQHGTSRKIIEMLEYTVAKHARVLELFCSNYNCGTATYFWQLKMN